MKLYMIRGCVCDTLEIDDKKEVELSTEEKTNVLDYILKDSPLRKLYKPEDLNEFICNLCETFGEYKYLGKCDQCGDWIEEYKLII